MHRLLPSADCGLLVRGLKTTQAYYKVSTLHRIANMYLNNNSMPSITLRSKHEDSYEQIEGAT